MLELTVENVDKIYEECSIDYDEIKDQEFPEGTEIHGARMLIPLPNGANAALFDIKKIDEYREEIGQLLDQIPYMSEKTGVSFPFLGKRNDGTDWTNDPYTMQKLYLLGVVSDQCVSIMVNGSPSIGRINKDKAIVQTIATDETGKRRTLNITIGGKEIKPE